MSKPHIARSLRFRFFLVLVLFLTISFLAAGWLSTNNTTKVLDSILNERFSLVSNNLENHLRIKGQSTKALAYRLSQEHSLVDAISNNNHKTIRELFLKYTNSDTTQLLLLLDINGKVVEDNRKGAYIGRSFEHLDIFKDTIKPSTPDAELTTIDNRLVSISSAAVANKRNSSTPAGIILAVFPVNTAFLEQVKGSTELDISVIDQQRILASTVKNTGPHSDRIDIEQDTYDQLLNEQHKNIPITIFDTPYINRLAPLATNGSVTKSYILLSYPQKEHQDYIDRIYQQILMSIIAGIIIALVLALWLFRDFLKSINTLRTVVGKISHGDFKSRILINTGDELQILADTFNTMIDTVESTNKTLSRYNSDLEREVEVRTRDYIKEERAHAASERKIKAIIDNIVVGLVTTDEDGNIETFNPAAEKMFGYQALEIAGKSISILIPSLRDKEHNQDIFGHLNDNNNIIGRRLEVTGKRKDGSTFPHLLSISEMYLPTHSSKSNEGAIRRYFIAIMQDLTETKRTEEILRRAQKMEALGQLTGGIAHDFNNLLGIIVGNLDLLKEDLEEGPIKQHARSALKAALRGSDLTRRLLAFSRKSTPETKPLCINQIITDMQNLIEKSLTASISVQVSLDKDLWFTDVNQGELEDAIINLAVNAKDAMPNGGKLLITTENSVIDESYAKNHTGAELGEHVLITVRDTGSGISEDIIEKVLDPFFTTKPGNKGSGLGLSMVYGFVKRARGYINLISKPDAGTTVEIFLPRSYQDLSCAEHSSAGMEPIQTGGNEAILLVDDEPDLALIAEGTLRKYGYRVLKAGTASEAIDILSKHPEIDLLFSDVVMPGGMDGFALAQYTKQSYPKIKILLASGFTHKTNKQQHDSPGHAMLRKPYRKHELIDQIRKTLDSE